MNDILFWVRVVRPGGMTGLRGSLDDRSARNPFINYGLNMILSEYRPEDLRCMMETAAEACYERDTMPVEVLQAMTSHAPAFGMVGTLIGMVAMLSSLTDNVSSIGSNLAVAFLSTLYGVLSARLIQQMPNLQLLVMALRLTLVCVRVWLYMLTTPLKQLFRL